MASGSLNSELNVNISIGGASVPIAGFGVLLFLDEQAGTLATNRYAEYTTTEAIDGDADLSAKSKAALKAALAQSPTPSKVAAGHWDITGVEAIGDALTAVKNANNAWYGLCASTRDEAEIQAAATWIESESKIYGALTADADVKAGTAGNVAEDLAAANRLRTWLLYHDATSEDWAEVAIMGKKLATDLDSQTTGWKYTTVSGPAVDDLTDTEITNIRNNNANVYEEFYGNSVFADGRMADGTPIDIVTTLDWMTARMNEGIARLLVDFSNRNSKVPYDDIGIQLVAAEIEGVIRTGERAGHFTVGSWSAQIPLAKDVSSADRTARLVRIPFSVEALGAIEKVTVTGVLEIDI